MFNYRTLRSFLLLILSTSVTNAQNSKIYSFFPDEWYQHPPLERTCFTMLKADPIMDADYLAVPWTTFLSNSRDKELNVLKKLKLNNGFTVCHSRLFKRIVPLLKKIGVNTIFSPHVQRGVNYGITVVPIPHLVVQETIKKKHKNIKYSFIGVNNARVRSALFAMQHPDNTVIIKRDEWHHHNCDGNEKKNHEIEYWDVLSRSRFSLCPRGTGPSTIRFWEALCVGSIPVLLADDLVLPDGFDWSSCVVFVPEKQVASIAKIIASITPQKEAVLRKNCAVAYAAFSGKNFIKPIHRYYAAKRKK